MAVPNPAISIPGTMAATITRLSALKSQLTSRCNMVFDCKSTSMAQLYTGTSGFAYPSWKPRFYPAGHAGQEVSGALRQPAELRGNQLHVPATARGNHPRKLGEGHARRLSVCLQGQHADHAYPAAEGCWRARSSCFCVRSIRCAPLAGWVQSCFNLPPNLKFDMALLSDFLVLLPSDLRFSIEFRHTSWLDDAVYDALQESAMCRYAWRSRINWKFRKSLPPILSTTG